ncbi:MAG TPA: hypothetical protein VHX59_22960 [Mycobacteriales bacterium]|nr:hypothetical protein [Mycobacteriales bacterium]
MTGRRFGGVPGAVPTLVAGTFGGFAGLMAALVPGALITAALWAATVMNPAVMNPAVMTAAFVHPAFVTPAFVTPAVVHPAFVSATVGGWTVRIGLPVAGLVSPFITGS